MDTNNLIVPDVHAVDYPAIMAKLFIVWIGAIAGITLNQWAAFFAILYTLLQMWVLIRDKLLSKRSRRSTDIYKD